MSSYRIGNTNTDWITVWNITGVDSGTYLARFARLQQFNHTLFRQGIPCVLREGSEHLLVYCRSPQIEMLFHLIMPDKLNSGGKSRGAKVVHGTHKELLGLAGLNGLEIHKLQ